jgi:carbohydrate binding protein with CBM6 domain
MMDLRKSVNLRITSIAGAILIFMMFPLQAQTPTTMLPLPPSMPMAPDITTSQAAAGTSLLAYKTWLEQRLGDLWIAVLNLQAAFPSAATPIIIPACAISGVEGQDLVHGSRQDSSDPTYKCKAGWIKAGEHLIYTVYIPAPGAYTFTAGVASLPGTGAFHLEITGQLRSGYVSVPQTATWSTYTTVGGGTVNFAESGVVSFDVVSDTTNDFDLLWLEFAKK